MLRVGSKFDTFEELSQRLEEFQKAERVQLWVRDSRTVIAAAKRARRKSLNPALKYAELTYSCVFGGRRPSDTTKIHNQTSAGGCPFKVRLSTSGDGQALLVKEINNSHNHEPGKKLHDEPRRLFKKTQSRFNQDSVEGATTFSIMSGSTNSAVNMSSTHKQPIKLIVGKNRLNSTLSPFANLQQFQHQHPHQQMNHASPQLLKLHVALPEQAQRCFIKKQDPELVAEPSVITPDSLDATDSLYSFPDFSQHQNFQLYNTLNLNTPSNSSISDTPESSENSSPDNSMSNTPNNSPNNSPTNSLSSGVEESVMSFSLPLSPTSPTALTVVCTKPREDEDRPLEPLFELGEALEDGLARLPTIETDELPQMSNALLKFTSSCKKHEKFTPKKTGQQLQSSTSIGCKANAGSNGLKSNITGAVTHFPLVRTLTSSSNSIRVGFPANASLCRPRTINTSNGSYYINSETGLVKTVKASGACGGQNGNNGAQDQSAGQTTSIQYNLVSSKVTAGLGNGAKNAGKITIQHYMSSSTLAGMGANLNAVSKPSNINTDTSLPRAVPVLVGIAANAKSLQPVEGNIDSGNSSAAGPIKNYRAKIAKKPYPPGAIFKVVKSDSVSSSVETFDRLINAVTPDKIKIGLNCYNSTKSECSPVANAPKLLSSHERHFTDLIVPSLDMDRVISGMTSDVKPEIDQVITGTSLDIKSEELCSDTINPVNKMDQVISGGLEADIKTRNDLVMDDYGDLCDVTVKQEIEDICDQGNGRESLFVVDGLEPSLGDDIPLSPDAFFNVADLEKFDFCFF